MAQGKFNTLDRASERKSAFGDRAQFWWHRIGIFM
jgi:hypothetical protein